MTTKASKGVYIPPLFLFQIKAKEVRALFSVLALSVVSVIPPHNILCLPQLLAKVNFAGLHDERVRDCFRRVSREEEMQ